MAVVVAGPGAQHRARRRRDLVASRRRNRPPVPPDGPGVRAPGPAAGARAAGAGRGRAPGKRPAADRLTPADRTAARRHLPGLFRTGAPPSPATAATVIAMSRQLRTLVIGVVLCLVLGILSFGMQVPYLVESPGPTFNTLGTDDGKDIIAVSGHPVTPTTGHLNLMTVSASTENTTILGAIGGGRRHDGVGVPHDSLYPPGTTQEEQDQQNSEDFVLSQQNAVEAAACELGYPKGLGVNSVPE